MVPLRVIKVIKITKADFYRSPRLGSLLKNILYRYMYLKIAWHLKTYIDTDSSIDFEKLH